MERGGGPRRKGHLTFNNIYRKKEKAYKPSDNLRAQIKELMGSAAADDDDITFDSNEVCRMYLVDACPYGRFDGCKMDVPNICAKTHDPSHRFAYEKRRNEFAYEVDAYLDLKEFLDVRDRKIQERSEALKTQMSKCNAEEKFKNEEIARCEKLIEEAKESLRVAEEANMAGNVAEWNRKLEAYGNSMNRFRREIAEAQTQRDSISEMIVCEICGSYIADRYVDKRLLEHKSGKMHKEMVHLKMKLDELKVICVEKKQRWNQNDKMFMPSDENAQNGGKGGDGDSRSGSGQSLGSDGSSSGSYSSRSYSSYSSRSGGSSGSSRRASVPRRPGTTDNRHLDSVSNSSRSSYSSRGSSSRSRSRSGSRSSRSHKSDERVQAESVPAIDAKATQNPLESMPLVADLPKVPAKKEFQDDSSDDSFTANIAQKREQNAIPKTEGNIINTKFGEVQVDQVEGSEAVKSEAIGFEEKIEVINESHSVTNSPNTSSSLDSKGKPSENNAQVLKKIETNEPEIKVNSNLKVNGDLQTASQGSNNLFKIKLDEEKFINGDDESDKSAVEKQEFNNQNDTIKVINDVINNIELESIDDEIEKVPEKKSKKMQTKQMSVEASSKKQEKQSKKIRKAEKSKHEAAAEKKSKKKNSKKESKSKTSVKELKSKLVENDEKIGNREKNEKSKGEKLKFKKFKMKTRGHEQPILLKVDKPKNLKAKRIKIHKPSCRFYNACKIAS